MKRSIKFAGIAAATLLAVAPVATTTVSAASSAVTYKTNKISVSDALAKFENQDLDASEIDAQMVTDSTTKLSALKGKDLKEIDSSDKTSLLGLALSNNTTSEVKNTKFIAVPLDNQSKADFDNVVTSRKENGGSFKYQIIAINNDEILNGDDATKDGNKSLREILASNDLKDKYIEGSKEVTINVTDVDVKATSLDVNFDQPSKAVLGSQVVDSMLTSSNHKGLTVENQTGNEVKNYTILSTNKNAYRKDSSKATDEDAAMAALANSDAGISGLASVSNNEVYKDAGTYFQGVVLEFTDNVDLAKLIADHDVTVNGTKLTSGNKGTVWTSAVNNHLTVLNKIEVGTDYYTDAKDKGVATVTNEDRAQVYNYSDSKHAMVPVSGKKFDKGSKWYTDIKRTLTIDGSTYRRVSTNEWLKTSDVSFDAAK